MKGILGALFLLVLCSGALGFCFTESSTSHVDCVTPEGTRLLNGPHLVPSECLRCTCTTHPRSRPPFMNATLSCCGYGYLAGPIGAPSGCKVIGGGGEDGCEGRLVSSSDETRPCPAILP